MGYTVEFKDFPSGTTVLGAFDMAPEASVAFMRDKGLKPTFHYLDMLAEEHVNAFTVAKMMDMDLLADVQSKVTQMIDEGADIQRFRRELTPFLQEKGWWGKTTMTDPLTGQSSVVQLGSAHRLNTIFRTNVQSAYAVGQWEMIQDQADDAPWLMYDAVDDYRTRPQHAAWDNTILKVGDAWWSTHYPPNGYNCRCGTIQLDDDQLDSLGLKPTKTAPDPGYRTWTNPRTGVQFKIPEGVDPGFAYNVGAKRLEHIKGLLTEKIAALPAAMQAAAPAVDDLAETAWTKGMKAAEARMDSISPEAAALQELAQIEQNSPPYLGAALKALQKQKQWEGAKPSELLAAVKAKAEKAKQSAALAHYKQAKLKGKDPGPEAKAAYANLPEQAQADIDANIEAELNKSAAVAEAQATLDDIANNPQGQTLKAKALQNLKDSGDAEGMTAPELLDQVEKIAAAQQAKATKAAALSGYKKKVLDGKVPSPAQKAAFDSLDDAEQADFLKKIDDAKEELAAQKWWDEMTEVPTMDTPTTPSAVAYKATKEWVDSKKKKPKATEIKATYAKAKAKAEAEMDFEMPMPAGAAAGAAPEPDATPDSDYYNFELGPSSAVMDADSAVDAFVAKMGAGAYSANSKQQLKAWARAFLDPDEGPPTPDQWAVAKAAVGDVNDAGEAPFQMVLAQLRDGLDVNNGPDKVATLKAVLADELGADLPDTGQAWSFTKVMHEVESFTDEIVDDMGAGSTGKLAMRNTLLNLVTDGGTGGTPKIEALDTLQAIVDSAGAEVLEPLWKIAGKSQGAQALVNRLDYFEILPSDAAWNAIKPYLTADAADAAPDVAPSGAKISTMKVAPEPEPDPYDSVETPNAQSVDATPTIDPDNMTKVGPQKGSNPGGLYQDTTTGEKWYIKAPPDPEIARNEVLAAELYRAAGIDVPDLQLTTLDGKTAVASRIIDGVGKAPSAATKDWSKVKGAHRGFVVDAWLGNWDVVGLDYDNLLVKGGTAYRVDTGGALRYRAQGGTKGVGWGKTVGELKTLRDPATNAQAAKVFGNISDDDLNAGAGLVASIDDATIRKLVDKHGPASAAERTKLVDTLIARRNDIIDQFPEVSLAAKAAKQQAIVAAKTGLKSRVDSLNGQITTALKGINKQKADGGVVRAVDRERVAEARKLYEQLLEADGDVLTADARADLQAYYDDWLESLERATATEGNAPDWDGAWFEGFKADPDAMIDTGRVRYTIPKPGEAPSFTEDEGLQVLQEALGGYISQTSPPEGTKTIFGKLHRAHKIAVNTYTGSFYGDVNTLLRQAKGAGTRYDRYRDLANDGLRLARKYKGTAVRGVTNEYGIMNDLQGAYDSGTPFIDHGFMSASAGSKPAFDREIWMHLSGKSGVHVQSISQHQREREVLFPAGTKWTVDWIEQRGGRTHVHLTEVE